MKKYLILAAFAAVALGACTKVETSKDTVSEAITFSAYSGRSADTKAKPIGDVVELATQGGFGVFAYYTGNTAYASATTTIPNFMYNQLVEGTISGTSVTAWTYDPIKYWPNNDSNLTNGSSTWTDKVSFFAYAPYVADPSANSVGIIGLTGNTVPIGTSNAKVTYVVASNPANSVDFMYAEPLVDQTKQTTSGTVNFAFKHALTRLGFTVEGVFDETDLDANTNDVNSSTKIYINSLTVDTEGNNIPTGGTFDLKEKTWTANTAYTTLNIATANIPEAINADPGTGAGVTKATTNLLGDDVYFMFLPNDSAVNYTIRIVYTVITTDSKLSGGKSSIVNDITKKVSLAMEAGKAYTLRLGLGMTTVKVAATVTDWTPVTGTEVYLPVNVS